jgi:hypothetical protein
MAKHVNRIHICFIHVCVFANNEEFLSVASGGEDTSRVHHICIHIHINTSSNLKIILGVASDGHVVVIDEELHIGQLQSQFLFYIPSSFFENIGLDVCCYCTFRISLRQGCVCLGFIQFLTVLLADIYISARIFSCIQDNFVVRCAVSRVDKGNM